MHIQIIIRYLYIYFFLYLTSTSKHSIRMYAILYLLTLNKFHENILDVPNKHISIEVCKF